ncbi:MAG: GldG family protein [Gammaproteobacteria bacterium]|nr:GldG family protein [Gammaproteobacteria bacterium]
MNISPKTKLQVKIQNSIFYILLFIIVVLLAQLSLKFDYHSDWTANSRHSLSPTTITLLKQLDDDITIQAFISNNNEYKDALTSLLNRYQRYTDKLHIDYINPDFSPDLVRKLNIQQQGEMVVSNGDQQQHVYDLSEQSLTNAIVTVSRQQEQWLIFISGHGERTPLDKANFNLSTWGDQLKQKGIRFRELNLIEHSQIPENTAAIVIASPEQPWLEGEIQIIKDYIDQGGHLLWLAEPDYHHLDSLAEQLGIEFVPGTVIDPNAKLLGISDPQFVLVTSYANHPIGIATTGVTLFPQAVAIEHDATDNDWQALPLLMTQDNTWSEITPLNNDQIDPVFDLGNDTRGPLNLAYLLTRSASDNDIDQRIAIIGDGDFLSNTYIGNGSNLELGIALINWLVEDDNLISIPIKTTLDNQLSLSNTQSLVIGLGFLIAVPLLLLAIGFWIWWSRRRK